MQHLGRDTIQGRLSIVVCRLTMAFQRLIDCFHSASSIDIIAGNGRKGWLGVRREVHTAIASDWLRLAVV